MWAAAREKVFCQKFVCHGGVRMRRKHNGNKSWLCCPNARLRAGGRAGGGRRRGWVLWRTSNLHAFSMHLHPPSLLPSSFSVKVSFRRSSPLLPYFLSFCLTSLSASPLLPSFLSSRLSSLSASSLLPSSLSFLPLSRTLHRQAAWTSHLSPTSEKQHLQRAPFIPSAVSPPIHRLFPCYRFYPLPSHPSRCSRLFGDRETETERVVTPPQVLR